MLDPKRISLLASLVLVSSGDGHSGRGETARARPEQCRLAAVGVDSSWVEKVSRQALDSAQARHPDLVLEEINWIRTRSGIEEGALARFVSSSRVVSTGFGGLVWVDMETGCAIVLRRYE